MTPQPSIRAFIAVNLPAHVRVKVEAIQRRLKFALPNRDFRWADPAHIHLTLTFLGDVAAPFLDDLKESIHRTAQKCCPFSLGGNGLGGFPTLQRPRVIWLGIGGELDRLFRLQGILERETAPWKKPEARRFHPHLTLARIKNIQPLDSGVLTMYAGLRAAIDIPSWRVDRVELMESKLSSAGARYFQLAEFSLSGPSCEP